jgi:predicted Zn-dependent protease
MADYTPKQLRRQKINKVLLLVIGFCTAGSLVTSTVMTIVNAVRQPTSTGANAATPQSTQPEPQESDFRAVLAREPQNQQALQGLLRIQLQNGDRPGAIDTLGKLEKQNPGNPAYGVVRQQLLASPAPTPSATSR